MLDLKSTFVTEGTSPEGSAWQMLPIPMTRGVIDGAWSKPYYQFAPPCYEPTPPAAAHALLNSCARKAATVWISISCM